MDNPFEYAPASIERVSDNQIRIIWSDGHKTEWTSQQLRDACPCATCREKHGKLHGGGNTSTDGSVQADEGPIGLPVLSAAEARPMRIEQMRPVGTYAYNIAFSDGHSSGLFTFARLRREHT